MTSLLEVPDYSRLRFECVVDFVEIHLAIARQSQFRYVRDAMSDAMRAPMGRVSPIESGPGSAAARFIARFDDLACWDQALLAVSAVEANWGLAEPPRIVALEVSLDAYSKAQDEEEMRQLADRFFRLAKEHCSDNSRFVRRRGDVVGAGQTPYGINKFRDGYTLVIGNKRDQWTQRCYYKQTDRGVQIPLGQRRARWENTWTGDLLPIDELQTARDFQFEKLASVFQFRKLVRAENPVAGLALERQIIHGARAPRGPRGRRSFSATTRADLELNALVYDKLRALTNRMRKPYGRKSGRLSEVSH